MSLRKLVVAGAVVMTLGASDSVAQDNPTVVVETSLGNITLELFREQAPITVANFLEYANDGFYAGTVFHRVIQQFMIQGGGMTARHAAEAHAGSDSQRGDQRPSATSAAPSPWPAPTSSTAPPRSSSSTPSTNARSLDNTGTDARSYGYAVFGRVTDGMDVVDRIAAVPTGTRGPHRDVPVEPVVITGVSVN